jgi:PAS domain S-box-containing protein
MQKAMVNELGYQFDLAKQKEKLQDYSVELEKLVAERTKELYKSQQRYRALFAYATEGILLLDETGSIIKANDAACGLYGYENDMLVGMNVRVLETDVNEELLHDRMHRLFAGEHLVYETIHKRRDGTTLNVEVSAKTIQVEEEVFIQSFYRDVTEKKKMQEHLFQAQKMESVGLLASGIAHDFNNILSAILGYTELIRRITPSNPKVANGLSVIENASRRAGRMISQLLDFSRKSAPEVHPFSLNDVVNDTVRMLARSIGDAVRVRLVLDDGIPAIEGDITKVGQVVMNLIVNARDAMPSGGVLTIETYGVQAGSGWSGIPPYVRAGRYVVLRMSDTGMGIPKELQGKIFEPFFTTKARGKGTGLGLAMTYGVVTEHKGYISVDSEENRGTAFTIYLPTTGRIRARDAGRRLPSGLAEPDTILVVEDEEALLSLMKETLETNGYRVLAAKDPAAALEAFRKTHDEISLVITDLALPVMNGRDMVQQMRDVEPEMKVIEVSGYGGSDGEMSAGRREAFIQKPFESQVLVATVQRVLGLSGTGQGSQTITTS